MTMRRFAAVVCVGMFLLVGCRDRSTPQNKADKLCVEMGKLDGTVTQMTAATVNPTPASLASFKSLRDQLAGQYAGVEAAAKDVTAYHIDKFTTTYNNFVKTVNGVNDVAALSAKHAEIDAAAGELATARLDLYDTGKCA